MVGCTFPGMEEVGGFTTAHTLSDQDIVTALARIHTTETSLAASRLALLAEAERRGLALKLGHSSIKRWYSNAVRIPEGNAAHQIALGYWLGAHPSVAHALSNGTIHILHAKAVADGHSTILTADPTLTDTHQADAVTVLLDIATRSLPRTVTDRAHELAHQAACDARARHETERRRREEEQRHKASDKNSRPDSKPGDQPPAPPSSPPVPPPGPPMPPPVPVAENTALNTLGIYPLANGRSKIDGNLDKLTTEKLKTALSPLTAPTPAPDGTRDPRTPNKRNADGLAELLDRYLSGHHNTGPSRTDVKLIVPLTELMEKPPHRRPDENHSGNGQDGGGRGNGGGDGGGNGNRGGGGGNSGGGGDRAAGDRAAGERTAGDRAGDPPTPDDPRWPFHLDWTGPISRHLAELLTCDADLTPIIVDAHGVPLALGRTIRLATPAQRDAVTIRDHCCVMCGRPAQWCEVHHVTYWQNGGATDLNNLALLCTECHRQIHNTDWQLAMGEDGHPQVIPPAETDPEQQPIPSYHRRRKHRVRKHSA